MPTPRTFRQYAEAKVFVHSLGLKSSHEWKEWCKSGDKPNDIPANPPRTYKQQWESWGAWLGTGRLADQLKVYRTFEDARKYVHGLKLKNMDQWKAWCKSGQKPDDIPARPDNTYKEKWKYWGDWLGTGYISVNKRDYLPFEDARRYVQGIKLTSSHQWTEWCKSGQKPANIPADPSYLYKKKWKGMGDWLGTGYIATYDRKYLDFEKAREAAHKLGLKTKEQWTNWCKSGEKPDDIPANPIAIYKDNWKGWGDWLSTGTIALQNKVYRSFEDARKFVHGLKLKNRGQWGEWCKSGKKPDDIPASPGVVYKEKWKGWGDWLGTGYVAFTKRHYLPFEEVRNYVHGLKFKTVEQWKNWCKSGKKPDDIPASPNIVYKKQWKSMGDWLGTDTIAQQNKVYRSFEEAHKYVMQLQFRSREEYSKWCKSGQKPDYIPASPDGVYKEKWKGWGDWLGTGYVAVTKRHYLTFEEARKYVHTLHIDDTDKWFEYCKSGNKPDDIPANPNVVYEGEWISWPDWLGYEERKWSLRKVKELLRDLIETRIIYQWDEAVLYSLLLRKGLLDLSENRHTKFFKSLIEAGRTKEGRKVVEEYVNSDSEAPPDLSEITQLSEENEGEIQTASSQELAEIAGKEDPLDYGQIKTAEQILANTDILESINVDEEAIQFYLDYSINELWKSAFRYGEDITLNAAKRNGNRFHDEVVDTFLTDYAGTQVIKSKLPDGYSFPLGNPTLMQLYVAHKINTNSFFGNFSGTGAGKTLSAVLASRVIDSKMTVIVCPNDVVEQWAKHIVEIFPDSKALSGKEAFNAKYDKDMYQYLVLNYDKFSLEDSPNLILNLVKEKVDFIILDEVHFVKKRDEETSKRRKYLAGLVTAVRRKNNQAKVLGLSATPVVNNLMEGRSLLELITGKIYDDISPRPTIPNAVTLYEKLSTISIRELPQYNIDIHTEDIEVKTERPPNLTVRYLKSNPLAIEQFLTDARIPEIIKRIDGQTIIYTEYVTDVIEKLSSALKNAGYSYAEYTGSDHSGKDRFLNKKVQVLLASRPISVGVDGLQHICNRLIINTLPWTNAQYQQLLGRLVRKGQITIINYNMRCITIITIINYNKIIIIIPQMEYYARVIQKLQYELILDDGQYLRNRRSSSLVHKSDGL